MSVVKSKFSWLNILTIYLILSVTYGTFSGFVSSKTHYDSVIAYKPEATQSFMLLVNTSPYLDLVFPVTKAIDGIFISDKLEAFISNDSIEVANKILNSEQQHNLWDVSPVVISFVNAFNQLIIGAFLVVFTYLLKVGFFLEIENKRKVGVLLMSFFAYVSLIQIFLAAMDFRYYYLMRTWVPDAYSIEPISIDLISYVFPYGVLISVLLYKLFMELIDKYAKLESESKLTI